MTSDWSRERKAGDRLLKAGGWCNRCHMQHTLSIEKSDGRYYAFNGPHLVGIHDNAEDAKRTLGDEHESR